MKQLFTAILAFSILSTAISQPSKSIVHDANAEIRTVGDFTGIRVSGGISVYLSQGTTNAVAVSMDDEKDSDKIKTEVKDGILNISLNSSNWKTWNWKNRNIKAYVTIKDIELIKASGACAIHIVDKITANNLKAEMSGASSFKGGELKVNTFKLEVNGASSVILKGSANETFFDVSGASNIRGYEFEIAECKAEASGASTIQLHVTKELKVEASGASTIRYKGSPAIKDIETSGASSIKKKDD